MSDGPFLWFVNRSTGSVLLVLFTLVVVLGVLATFGHAGRGAPRFLTQAFHRNVALGALALLLAHVTSAVTDTYVDIRLWQAFVPFGGTYRPLYLGLGALALDVILVVVATSLVRTRLPHRSWRAIHVLGYAAWALSVVHGLGIGTDSPAPWSRALTAACVGAVVLVTVVRLGALVVRRVPEAVR